MRFVQDLQALLAQRGQPGFNDYVTAFLCTVAQKLSEDMPAAEKDADGIHQSFSVHTPALEGLAIPKGQEARKLGAGPQMGSLPPGGTVIGDPPPPAAPEEATAADAPNGKPAPHAQKGRA